MSGFDRHGALLAKLGKSYLYVRRLAEVDLTMPAELVSALVKHWRETHD